MHRSPEAPDLQQQRQGQSVGQKRPRPVPRPRLRALQRLLLPLLSVFLQRRLPAPCDWELYRLLCFLLHGGVPENGDGAARGNPAAARGGRSHRLQPVME